MQFGSYLQVIAATMGFFGIVLTILGAICLKLNRSTGLLALPWRELRLEQVKRLTAQKNLLVSGLTLVVLFILGLVAPWVFNLAERQVFEGHSGVAIYASIMLGGLFAFRVWVYCGI